ncbi:MAG: DEAD/DEAH box helicase [Firmicutes bacterium]|nr:DEAD/DEAH box helicase [Bacillota bacterium]
MKFNEMNLSDYIIKGLDAQGIETPTEIQEVTIPLVKSGVDVIGLSQTGSGKTYAYGIPALERVDLNIYGVQFLVVCPTRELAAQIADNLKKLTNFTSRIGVIAIFGGASMDRQIQSLKRGAKIVVGTPGRLMDHLRRKTLKLDNLKMVILDEADEMLNMGFKEDIETILKSTPDSRQTVMFSATMPPEIVKITKLYMKEPVMIKAKNQDCAPALIKQYYISCKRPEKPEILEKIYTEFNPWISIVFCNTIQMTQELSTALKKNGLPAVCLNGDMRQSERRRVMDKFKNDEGGGILVATDVAARGLDIKNVDVVINFDFPNNDDYYVHRIGRTGRAGKDGVAISLITSGNQLKDLQTLTNKDGVEEYTSLSTTKYGAKELSKGRGKPRQSFNKQRNHSQKANAPRRESGEFKRLGDKRESKENHQKREETGFVGGYGERREGLKGNKTRERFGKPNTEKRERGGFNNSSEKREKSGFKNNSFKQENTGFKNNQRNKGGRKKPNRNNRGPR